MSSQIKYIKHIEQNFYSVAWVIPQARGGTWGCLGVKKTVIFFIKFNYVVDACLSGRCISVVRPKSHISTQVSS